jgi:hypothetical protein
MTKTEKPTLKEMAKSIAITTPKEIQNEESLIIVPGSDIGPEHLRIL